MCSFKPRISQTFPFSSWVTPWPRAVAFRPAEGEGLAGPLCPGSTRPVLYKLPPFQNPNLRWYSSELPTIPTTRPPAGAGPRESGISVEEPEQQAGRQAAESHGTGQGVG